MRPFLPLLLAGALLGLASCDDLTNAIPGSSSSASETASETFSEAASETMSESMSESASSSSVAMVEFPYTPATQLTAGSGQGYTDTSNWAPGICFPIAGLAYANSQVYRPGGSNYPTASATNHGSQCDASNYAYPWVDNFCESRSWSNVMCKTGQGHQGQDIRPATCKSNLHWAVAAEDGVVTQVGSYTVAITGNGSPHRIYRYLHLQSSTLRVKVGDEVKRGQKIGLVSNNLGTSNGVPQYTTIHLHFEVRIAQSETLSNGTVLTANTFVPPYNALVDAYSRSLAGDCPVVE